MIDIEIPLRKGREIVRFDGMPVDLKPAEALRIAKIIRLLVPPKRVREIEIGTSPLPKMFG